MPDTEGSVRIATSAIKFGMTCPGIFSDPTKREYQSLQLGQRCTDLTKVPKAWKDTPDADLTKLPGKQGFADLIQIINEPWEKTKGPAWITATIAERGYLWFALKDPAVLHSTVFWLENRSRHGHPWNGRNNCLGLEDVTAHFADGLAASTKENVLIREGVETALALSADKPTSVNYIQGAVQIPSGLENVETIEFAPGEVTPSNHVPPAAGGTTGRESNFLAVVGETTGRSLATAGWGSKSWKGKTSAQSDMSLFVSRGT